MPARPAWFRWWYGVAWLAAACVALPVKPLAQPVQGARSERVEALYEKGAKDYAGGRFARAADEFRSALAIEPSSPKLLNDLGVAYYMEGQLNAAVATLKKAVAADPKSVSANLILGLALVRLNQPSVALAPFKHVIALEPANKDALAGLASADFALGKMGDAVTAYLRLVALRPHDANAWYGLGICFERLSETDTRWMARNAPRSAYYHELVGEFLLRQGSEFDAEQEFREAIKSGGTDFRPGAEAQLGYALLEQQVFLPAEQEFERALAGRAANPDAMLGLAAVAIAQSHADAARKWLCGAFALNPDSFPSHVPVFVGALSPKAGRFASTHLTVDTSFGQCREAVRLVLSELARPGSLDDSPNAFAPLVEMLHKTPRATSPPGHSGRDAACANVPAANSSRSPVHFLSDARCAYESGWFYASFELSEQALRSDSSNAESRYWSAEAAARLAREAFLRLVSLNPSAWQSRVLLGDIYRERKQWQQATANYEAAARLMPSSPAPFLGLATVAWQNGLSTKAEGELREVLKLDPRNVQANFEMGDILVRQHSFGAAAAYLQQSLSVEPELLTAHADLGKCYAGLGKTRDAITEIRVALPTDRDGELHYLLYLQYKKAGDMAGAQQALAESEQLRGEQLRAQRSRLSEAMHAAQSRSTH